MPVPGHEPHQDGAYNALLQVFILGTSKKLIKMQIIGDNMRQKKEIA